MVARIGSRVIIARLTAARKRLEDPPPIVWIMLGFALSYIFFFIRPVFFSGPKMDTLGMLVPIITPIGADLRQTLAAVRELITAGVSPYSGEIAYPPLTHLLLSPLLLLTPPAQYAVVSATTLLVFTGMTLALPMCAAPSRRLSLEAVLVLVTGLVSYGLLFELERGQFNVIAAGLAFAALLHAHSHGARGYVPWILLSISAQLKIYPAIFFVAMIRDWRDWKHVFRTVVGMLAVNAALLLILGKEAFLGFVHRVSGYSANLSKIRMDNHSVYSFAGLVGRRLQGRAPWWSESRVDILQAALLILIGLCLLAVVISGYRRVGSGLNPDLLLACALVAVLVPGVSHDYTITILAAPVALFLSTMNRRDAPAGGALWRAALLLLFSFTYSSTLVPLGYKPALLLLGNNFPALFVLLVVCAVIAWKWPAIPGPDHRETVDLKPLPVTE
jgi:hypothetical protein